MSINWSNFHKKELIVRMLEEMNIPLCLPLKKKKFRGHRVYAFSISSIT